MTDDQATGAAPGPDSTATTKIPRPPADDFAPDVPPPDDIAPAPERRPRRSPRPAERHGADAGLRPPARRLRRRSHPRAARVRTCRENRRSRPRHRRRGRPPHSRRHHRRWPLPAAGLPRRPAQPAVLAGARHRAGPAGRADVRRPGRDAARRAAAGDPVAHAEAEPPGHARRRAGARRGQHRLRRAGGFGVDPRRLAARSGRDVAVADRRGPRDPDRWPRPPRPPTARASRCRSTIPAGCG